MSAGDPEPGEGELEQFLRRFPPERPDAARRATARQRFLAGEEPRSREEVGPRMRQVMPPGAHLEGPAGEPADLDAFARWLGARAVLEQPAPEARRRARLAFLSALAHETGPTRRTRRSFRGLVLALAAAAILAVTFLLPEPERWRVHLGGAVSLDDRPFTPEEEERLAAALESSGVLETAGERARLQLGETLELELLAGSTLTLPALPELDGVTPLAFELARGEAYVRTRPGYPGNPVVLHTAMAEVALHGTTVGVLVDELGTCVCVAEGTAQVTSALLGGARQDVGPRSTLRLFQDATRTAKLEPFPDDGTPGAAHTDDLVEFQREP